MFTRSKPRPPGRRLFTIAATAACSFFTLVPGPAQATVLHVPATYPTIQAALDVAGPGDTVEVASGVFPEKIVFPASGSAGGGYITVQAAPGATPILDGTGVAGDDMVLIDSRSYVKLVGFEIRNNLGVNDGSGVRVVGSGSHIEIRSNRIHDMRGLHAMGITVYGTEGTPISNLVIDGNEIYDCEPYSSEAMTLNGNVDGFQVTNNQVRDVNNIGIDFIGGEADIQPDPDLVARNGVVRGNRVERARQQGGGWAGGIYVDGGRDILIDGNTITECDLGIEIGAENAGIVTTGIVVRNNVVFSNDRAGIVFGGYDSSVGRANNNTFRTNTCVHNDSQGHGLGELWIQWAENNSVENNLFYSTSQNVLLYSDAGNVGTTLDFNLWFTDDGAGDAIFVWNGVQHTGFDAYRNATGQDAGSVFADPLLAAPGTGDLHITAGSPAIDAGDPALVPDPGETDIDGEPRLAGTAVDAGADELHPGLIFADGFESGDTTEWTTTVTGEVAG